MQDSSCIKCGNRIYCKAQSSEAKCRACGATYELEKSDIDGQHISCSYKFVHYRCIYSSIMTESCNNVCPSSYMYCKEHISDDDFDSANRLITHTEQQLKTAVETLERMKESKRIWLIQEVSGIYDDAV